MKETILNINKMLIDTKTELNIVIESILKGNYSIRGGTISIVK